MKDKYDVADVDDLEGVIEGFTHVAVQSLHTIGGAKYHDLRRTVSGFKVMGGFQRVILGYPILHRKLDRPVTYYRYHLPCNTIGIWIHMGKITFVQNVHSFLIRSSTPGFFIDARNRAPQELVTSKYRAINDAKSQVHLIYLANADSKQALRSFAGGIYFVLETHHASLQLSGRCLGSISYDELGYL